MRTARRLMVPVVLVLMIASALPFAQVLTEAPRAMAPEQPLIAFLLSHHLTYGLGSYWAANITTVESDGKVCIVPIVDDDGHILALRDANLNGRAIGTVLYRVACKCRLVYWYAIH